MTFCVLSAAKEWLKEANQLCPAHLKWGKIHGIDPGGNDGIAKGAIYSKIIVTKTAFLHKPKSLHYSQASQVSSITTYFKSSGL